MDPTTLPALPNPATTGLGDEYEAFDRNGRAMGKAYETISYFTAEQMRAYALAEREACAKLCDEVQEAYGQYTFTARVSAERIRAA